MSNLHFNNDNKDKRPLHERRWAEAKRKAADISFAKAAEKLNISLNHEIRKEGETDSVPDISVEAASNNFGPNGNTKGKNTKFKPLVYYNAPDALSNCMKQFKDQASKNIEIIKEAREAKGQRLAVSTDMKDVVGEFHEGVGSINIGEVPVSNVKMHAYIRQWLGYICYFEIVESDYGFGSMKRRGYCVEKVSVVYFQKNGVGMGKEVILKMPFFSIPKHPAKNDKN